MPAIYSFSDGSVKPQSSCVPPLIPVLVFGDKGNPLGQNDLGVPEQREAVAEIIPGPLSVMSKSGSQARITCEPRVANCLDTLKISFWVDWSGSPLLDHLELAKLKAQDGEQDSFPIKLAGHEWNCMRTGTRLFNFHLKRGDVQILFNRRSFDGVIPNARLEIGSQSCWTPGFSSVYDNFIKMIVLFGGGIVKERVSEFHMASDCIETSLQDLPVARQEQWITRAHKFSVNYDRGKFTGISVGKGDLMLRIYDKVQELRTQSTHKQPIFKEVWGMKTFDEKPVTRIEFQVRRAALREFSPKVDTLDDLKNSLSSLWHYLTNEWCRLAMAPVDTENKHQARAIIHPFWGQVQGVVWSGDSEVVRKKIYPVKDLEKIRGQLVGLVQSVAAILKREPDDIEGIIAFGQGYIESGLRRLYKDRPAEFVKRMRRKKNEGLCPFLDQEQLYVTA